MSLTFYNNNNQRGSSVRINGDYSSLKEKNFNNKANSLTAGKNDAALLFKDKKWKGNVLYVRGNTDINDLDRVSSPSNDDFSNKISSVRVNPFKVYVNFIVVTGKNGELPGRYERRDEINDDLDALISRANKFFKKEKALIEIKYRDTSFRANEKKFNMSEKERGSIPLAWKKNKTIDIVIVNQMEGAVGVGSLPGGGKFVVVAARRQDNVAKNQDEMARTFVHELGHYWSLLHRNNEPENIMAQTKFANGNTLELSKLEDWQINNIHQKLSKDIRRKGERYE